MSAFIRILGAEVNVVLIALRRDRSGGEEGNIHSLDTSGQQILRKIEDEVNDKEGY